MVLYNIILHLIYYLFYLSGDSRIGLIVVYILFLLLYYHLGLSMFHIFLSLIIRYDSIPFLQIDISVVYFLVHICSLLIWFFVLLFI
jgi:hypothetical protein